MFIVSPTDKDMIKLWSAGKVDNEEFRKHLIRYGVITDRVDISVVAGKKSDIFVTLAKVRFCIKMLNGVIKSIVRYHD